MKTTKMLCLATIVTSAALLATSAAASTVIEGFRRSFVSNDEDGMFDQMVGWTIARTYMDL